MLHLTVEALEAAAAAQLPTAHISHLQPGRCFNTGGPWCSCRKRHDPPLQLSNVDSSSAAGPIHACTPAALWPGRAAKSARMWLNANLVCMRGHSTYKEYFPILQPEAGCLDLR